MHKLFLPPLFTTVSISILMSMPMAASAQTLLVTSATPYTVSGTETFTDVTVENGGILTVDGTLEAGTMVVNSGGQVTHTPGTLGLRLDITGVLEIKFGGSIDASGQGLRGAYAGSAFGSSAEAIDPVTGDIVAGAGQYVGGSYGGLGSRAGAAASAVRNPTYGFQTGPLRVGSGGGRGSCSTSPGGHGGGLVIIAAGSLIADGAISANGGAPAAICNAGGGGSGGGVSITAGTLSGAGGISARGTSGGGNGGGGRLLINYTTLDYIGGMSTSGGAGGSPGSTGTAWILSSTGHQLIAGGHATLDGDDARASISFGVGGIMVLAGPATNAAGNLDIPTGATVIVDDTSAFVGIPIAPVISGELRIAVPYTFPAAVTITPTGRLEIGSATSMPALDVAGTLLLNARMDVLADVNVLFGGVLTHSEGNDEFDLRAVGRIDVADGALIDATGKGLTGGSAGGLFGSVAETYDPITLELIPGSGRYSGGSHGGLGGMGDVSGPPNAIYGSETSPVLLGAGGGRGSCSTSGGARGGGKFRLEAATLHVDGAIIVNGGAPAPVCNHGGGGAGGSIWAIADTLAGSGFFWARGGDGTGSGGGGRIAVEYTTSTFTGNFSTRGGIANVPGAQGSVRAISSSTDAVLQAGIWTVDGSDSFASMTLMPGAQLIINGPVTIAAPLLLADGATIVAAVSDAFQNASLVTAFEGHLIVTAPMAFTSPISVIGELTLDAPTTATEVEISGRVNLNTRLTTSGDVNIRSGALVTHALSDVDSEMFVATTLTIEAGGSWDATGRGLHGGSYLGANNKGLTQNPTTLAVEDGSPQFTGGSYGGRGAGSGPALPYGDVLEPALRGGGGGGGSCSTSVGGHGGGVVRIDANLLVNRGDILAMGGAALAECNHGGGGAGGSIWITVDTLEGYGEISANGGGGTNGGGGGRVAITYTTSSYTGLIRALGGSVASRMGESGTTYVNGGGTDLTVSGGQYEMADADSAQSVTLKPGGILVLSGAASIFEPINIVDGSTVILTSSNALDSATLAPDIAGNLIVSAPFALPTSLDVSGTITINSATTLAGDLMLSGEANVHERFQMDNLDMQPGALLTHAQGEYFMHVVVDGIFTLARDARVDVTAKGLRGGADGSPYGNRGTSLDPANFFEIPGSDRYNGGSHAGLGGEFDSAVTLAAVYGDPANPIRPGGGGGGGSCSTSTGGYGGGVVRISAAIARLSGDIMAEGDVPVPQCNQGGAGAGGSIYLDFAVFEGGSASIISAAGGQASRGAGGGGYVLLDYASKTFAGSVHARGGPGGPAGGDGVVTETISARAPEILSTPPTFAGVDTTMSYQAVAAGTPIITWELTGGPGLASIDAATGLLTWVASLTGDIAFEITASSTEGTAVQAFTVSVLAPPIIISTPIVDGIIGTPYFYDSDGIVEATGTAPLTWSLAVAPAGATINASTAMITWTPTVEGDHTMCIAVENSAARDQVCHTITVASNGGKPIISSTPSLTGEMGVAYAYDADGAAEATSVTPLTWSVVLASAGLTIDASTGAITWTPDSEGVHGICIAVSNAMGSDQQCFSVVVGNLGGAPKIDSTPSILALVGVPYSYDDDDRVSASGPPFITYARTVGPAEMSIDAQTGLVSWTPAASGNVGIVISATNSRGTTEQGFTVSVMDATDNTPPIIVHSANPLAAAGVPYLFDNDRHIEAGGAQPLTWAVTAGPTEFRVDERTGLVTWLPAISGVATMTVSATNSLGSDSYTFSVDVLDTSPPEPHAVALVSPKSGSAPLTIEVDGSQSYAPTSSIDAFIWTFGDDAPLDYEVDTTHTYTDPGSYVVHLEVIDTLGNSSTREETVIVTDGLVVPPSAQIVVSRVQGRNTLDVTFACACDKGSSPIAGYRWTTGDGTIFDGLSFTHTFGPGAYNVQLDVVDEQGLTARDEVLIEVSQGEKRPPIVIATVTPRSGIVPLTVEYEADHGDFDGTVDEVLWDFADGRMATDSRGEITYEEAGIYQVTVTVVDNDGLTATSLVEVTATTATGAVPPQILSVPETLAEVGEAYTYDPDGAPAARGTRPLTWTLGKQAGGDILGRPEGMEIDTNSGEIRWTPTSAGTVAVALVVTNEAGATLQEWDIEVTGDAAVDTSGVRAEGCGCRSSAASAWLQAVLFAGMLWGRRRMTRRA